MKKFFRIDIFPQRKTEHEVIQEAYRSVRIFQKWGRWSSLGFLVSTAFYGGLAYAMVKLGFDMAQGFLAYGEGHAEALFALCLGIASGIAGGLFLSKSLAMLRETIACLRGLDPGERLFVQYHRALQRVLEEEQGRRKPVPHLPRSEIAQSRS